MLLSATSCGKTEAPSAIDSQNKAGTENTVPSDTDNKITMPEGEDKKEEIIVNENYADSESYTFTGTVDEIYDDGSILVFSPEFKVNFNYNVIVEFDENTVIDNFTLKENQLVEFEVYSAVKKSEPLTAVAKKLTLLNEVSTQHEEEAAIIAKEEAEAKEILKSYGIDPETVEKVSQ